MEINRSFYIKVNEDGAQTPMMEFFPPKYSMLAHLGFDDFSMSNTIIEVIDKMNEAIKEKKEYSFASDDWCIVKVVGNTSTVSNGFDEFEAFEIDSAFIIKLLSDWMTFLKKYENKEIPGII